MGFYANFYQAIHDKLNPGGLWVTTVDDEDASDELLDILFDARRDMFPQKIVKQYQKALTTKEKTRVLLEIAFPTVLE